MPAIQVVPRNGPTPLTSNRCTMDPVWQSVADARAEVNLCNMGNLREIVDVNDNYPPYNANLLSAPPAAIRKY